MIRRCDNCGWIGEPDIRECPRCNRMGLGWSVTIITVCFIAYIGLFSMCDGCMGKDHTSRVINEVTKSHRE